MRLTDLTGTHRAHTAPPHPDTPTWRAHRTPGRLTTWHTAVLDDGTWLAVAHNPGRGPHRWAWVHAQGHTPHITTCATWHGYRTPADAKTAAHRHLHAHTTTERTRGTP